ncbi:MAG: hypothetical protein GY711_21040 [bacterium]|nr:hypothetical protein [bacterium]
MSTLRALALLTALLGVPNAVRAQVHMNETYVAMSGPDRMEFIELIGPPGFLLDGFVLLTLEGDGTTAGLLDHAWDLSGNIIPADGYFVVGTDMVPNLDYSTGTQDTMDNGTTTFYLIRTPQPAIILSLIGVPMDPDGDGVTDLANDPNVTIHEIIAIVDTGYPANDAVFDCTPVIGPDGTMLASGAFRPLDFPNPFCLDEYLDFNQTGNATHPPPTPGAPNPMSLTGCTPTSISVGCFADVPLGANYCTPALPNSTGFSASISGHGSPVPADGNMTLVAEGMPPGEFGYFLVGNTQGFFNPPGSGGFICMTGTIGRYNQAGNIGQGPSFSITIDPLALPLSPPVAGQPGDTWYFQAWFRDFGGATSNFTDGLVIQFL